MMAILHQCCRVLAVTACHVAEVPTSLLLLHVIAITITITIAAG